MTLFAVFGLVEMMLQIWTGVNSLTRNEKESNEKSYRPDAGNGEGETPAESEIGGVITSERYPSAAVRIRLDQVP